MTTVTDGSLRLAAQDIVNEFRESNVSLNEGVTKKASELGLNQDQTARLIERTNTEAFLTLYPSTTEFEVASPEVILGIKTAKVKTARAHMTSADNGEGHFKAASVNKTATTKRSEFYPTFQEKLDAMTGEDIFGIDDEFLKVAADTAYDDAIDIEVRSMYRALEETTKTASELALAETERELAFTDAVDDLVEHIKQASLSGEQSIAESEHELLNMFPEEAGVIRNLYDELTTKLAMEVLDERTLRRSPDVIKCKFAHESPLTTKFRHVLEILEG